MKILKFGGTSVQSADSMRQVLKCINKYIPENIVVILSAVSGTTDALIRATNLSVNKIQESHLIINEIEKKHLQIVNSLFNNNHNELTDRIYRYFNEIREKLEAFNFLDEITSQNTDSIQSYGEILSTDIFYEFLIKSGFDATLFDIRDYFKTDSEFTNANIDFQNSLNQIKGNIDFFRNNSIKIAQGFIASDSKNRTTTFGRGGSDYSAALIGKLLKIAGENVDEIQIWTDVDGVLSADPRLVESAKTIDYLSSNEIRTLSYLGAKVLHPETIKPAVSSKISLRILNTFNSECKGTLISDEPKNIKKSLKSIINIGKCYKLKMNSNVDNSLWNFAGKLTEIAETGKCKPIYFSSIENSLVLIFRFNEQIFRESSFADLIELNEINLIAFVGTNLEKVIVNFTNVLSDNFEIQGISNNAIFLVTKNEFELDELKKCHDAIINTDKL